MAKSKMNVNATLDVILYALEKYFNDIPDNQEALKEFMKPLNKLKYRIKLLVNDIYDYLIKNEDFQSGESQELHDNNNAQKRWDHAIPWEEFFRYLSKKNFNNTTELYSYLRFSFCNCHITKEEDQLLTKAGLRNKMPQNWTSWDARYKAVEIDLHKEPYNPKNINLNITPSTL